MQSDVDNDLVGDSCDTNQDRYGMHPNCGETGRIWGLWELSERFAGNVPRICGWIEFQGGSQSAFAPGPCTSLKVLHKEERYQPHTALTPFSEKSDHGTLQKGFGVKHPGVIHNLISLYLSFLTCKMGVDVDI